MGLFVSIFSAPGLGFPTIDWTLELLAFVQHQGQGVVIEGPRVWALRFLGFVDKVMPMCACLKALSLFF